MKPMTLVRRPKPFSHPDWIFEVKFDGFRALAYVADGHCELVSRKGITYQRFAKTQGARRDSPGLRGPLGVAGELPVLQA